MSWQYGCPECKALLNPQQAVILVLKSEGVQSLVGLHPQPGKYEVHLPPGVDCAAGTLWDFHCPVCQVKLVNQDEPNLCELTLHLEEQPLRILFSRVAGQHATFVLAEDKVLEKHGADIDQFQHTQGQIKYLV